jgi:phosphopentomutase
MRALLLVLDSVGIGAAPDADAYGDAGADTLGHVRSRRPGLALPALRSLGLFRARGETDPAPLHPGASYGRMREVSAGKDTTTGHWELAGAPLSEPFAVHERFPESLVTAIEREAGVTFLGNVARSGTAILDELGEAHLATGHPILYTSADSVLQIAAHDRHFSDDRLQALCRIARRHCDPLRIGRVIARPFTGEPGAFRRTAGRHDFSMRPPRTILDALGEAGRAAWGVGKIGDIFAGAGIHRSEPTASNAEGMETTARLWDELGDGLLFVNLVDFDMLFGHRRDPGGYALALEAFDAWLAAFLPRIRPGDLLIISADHGNDPTHPGSDHTREEVPLLAVRGSAGGGGFDLGVRSTLADIAASLAEWFGLPEPWPCGRSFLSEMPC